MNFFSTAPKWTAANVPAMTGKTVIITGGNSGLGKESARVLYEQGANVILACRSEERAQRTVADLQASSASSTNGTLSVERLDISEPASISAFAASIRAQYGRDGIDVLMNNAGIMALPTREQNSLGWEMQIATNHLGHFLLTAELLELLEKKVGSRIVHVASVAQNTPTKFEFGAGGFPVYDAPYSPWMVYGQTKLANMLFSEGLQTRLEKAGSKVISVAAHPGVSSTNLFVPAGSATAFGRWFTKLSLGVGMTAAQGALSQIRAASDPSIVARDYVGPDWMFMGYPTTATQSQVNKRLVYDTELQDKLWRESEKACRIAFLSDADECRFPVDKVFASSAHVKVVN